MNYYIHSIKKYAVNYLSAKLSHRCTNSCTIKVMLCFRKFPFYCNVFSQFNLTWLSNISLGTLSVLIYWYFLFAHSLLLYIYLTLISVVFLHNTSHFSCIVFLKHSFQLYFLLDTLPVLHLFDTFSFMLYIYLAHSHSCSIFIWHILIPVVFCDTLFLL